MVEKLWNYTLETSFFQEKISIFLIFFYSAAEKILKIPE